MKTIYSIRLLLPVAIAAVCFSCNKEQDSLHQNNLVFESPQRRTTDYGDPSNNQNPLDSVGKIHNQILDAVAFDDDFETLPIDSFTYSYVTAVRGWDDFHAIIPIERYNRLKDVLWNYVSHDDLDGAIDHLGQSGGYSSALTAQLRDLFSVLSLERGNVPIEALVDSIIAKENNFPAKSFSPYERNIYYGTASVLRYSASYWDAVISDESSSHPYYDIVVNYLARLDRDGSQEVGSRAFNWKKFWRGLAVVGADALGFAGGFALGSALSGGNPAVGAAGGTLIGGAASAEVRNIWNP